MVACATTAELLCLRSECNIFRHSSPFGMSSRLGTTARMNQARCVYRAQRHPAANQNGRLNQSPINALIDLEITGRLRCQIPVRLNSNTLARQRITTVAPQGVARVPGRRSGASVHRSLGTAKGTPRRCGRSTPAHRYCAVADCADASRAGERPQRMCAVRQPKPATQLVSHGEKVSGPHAQA